MQKSLRTIRWGRLALLLSVCFVPSVLLAGGALGDVLAVMVSTGSGLGLSNYWGAQDAVVMG